MDQRVLNLRASPLLGESFYFLVSCTFRAGHIFMKLNYYIPLRQVDEMSYSYRCGQCRNEWVLGGSVDLATGDPGFALNFCPHCGCSFKGPIGYQGDRRRLRQIRWERHWIRPAYPWRVLGSGPWNDAWEEYATCSTIRDALLIKRDMVNCAKRPPSFRQKFRIALSPSNPLPLP